VCAYRTRFSGAEETCIAIASKDKEQEEQMLRFWGYKGPRLIIGRDSFLFQLI